VGYFNVWKDCRLSSGRDTNPEALRCLVGRIRVFALCLELRTSGVFKLRPAGRFLRVKKSSVRAPTFVAPVRVRCVMSILIIDNAIFVYGIMSYKLWPFGANK
jgi:hypothetical protein